MTFAPVTVLTRKIENGTSGCGTRRSIQMNVSISTPDTMSSPIVRALAQPTSGAFETA